VNPDSTYHPDADPDFYLMLMRISFHTDANPDPDPSFQKKAKTLEKVLKKAFGFSSAKWCGRGSGSWFLFDADADPDPDFYLMRIWMWILITKMMRIHPKPQHCAWERISGCLISTHDISAVRN
jgi:hypothetical protein